MKKIISIFILLSFLTSGHAQKKKLELGFMGGLNLSDFYVKPAEFKKANLKSIIIGGDLGVVLNKTLSLRANVSYEVKGEETGILPTDDFGNQIDGYTNINLGYATLNILTRGTFGNKIRFYAEGGPYFSYLISAQAVDKLNSTVNFVGVNVTPGKDNIRWAYKDLNLGVTAGIGVIYPINDKTGMTLSIRKSLGLTSVNKFSDMKTNSTAIQLGVNFKL